jgi:hypothetical protein
MRTRMFEDERRRRERGRDPSLRARCRRPIPLPATSSQGFPRDTLGRGSLWGKQLRVVWGYMPFLHASQHRNHCCDVISIVRCRQTLLLALLLRC